MSRKTPSVLLTGRRASTLETRVERTRLWARHNQRSIKGVIGALTVLAVCVTAVLIYKGYQRRQGLQALQQGVEALYEQQEEDDSIRYLTQARNAFSTKAPAKALVLLHIGRAHARKNDVVQAQAVRQELAEAPTPMRVSYLRQVACVELGRTAEKSGDWGAARRWYQQATDMEGPLTTEALTALGYVLEKLGEPEKARLQYERIAAEYADAPLIEVVREKIEP